MINLFFVLAGWMEEVIFRCAKAGNYADFVELVNQDNFSITDHLNNTLLHYASGGDTEAHVEVMRYLFSLDKSHTLINAQNNLGETPLHRVIFLSFLFLNEYKLIYWKRRHSEESL